jgi:hypothetical protein
MQEEKVTTVVCVKVKYIRPLGYHNLKEWTNDPNNVYIGRKGIVFINNERFPKQDSLWANPFKVKEDTREQSLARYREYIKGKLHTGEISTKQLLALKGKTLGCWCSPMSCHGDVLLELLDQM